MATESVWAMDVAADGWELALKAITSLPRLFISGLLMLLLWELVSSRFGSALQQNSVTYLLDLLGQVVDTLVVASVVIAVHRFVMLNEVLDRPIWRIPLFYGKFVIWFFILDVSGNLPSDAALAVGVRSSSWFLWANGLYMICFGLVSLRLIILFPAIAIASPHAGWRNAWSDSRGHLWKFFWATFWVFLPAMIVLFAALLVISQITEFRTFIPRFSEALALCTIAGSLLVSAVAAAAASRFLQLYGNSLVQASGPNAPFAPSP